jgi:hypothetical protein
MNFVFDGCFLLDGGQNFGRQNFHRTLDALKKIKTQMNVISCIAMIETFNVKKSDVETPKNK